MDSPSTTSDNRLAAEEVIGLMSQAEKLQACKYYWQNETESKALAAAVERLEVDMKLRKGSLSKFSLDKKSEYLANRLKSLPYREWARRVLHFSALHTDNPPSTNTLLSALTEEQQRLYSTDPLPLSLMLNLTRSLLADYPARQVLLLFASLISSGKSTWQELPSALDQLGINLRQSLAASRELPSDPQVASLKEEVRVLKTRLAEATEAAAQSTKLFETAAISHSSEISSLATQIETLKSEREAAIKQRVELELSSTLRPWIAAARELERMSARRTDLSLSRKMSAALSKLETFDMGYGAWKRCMRRLSRLEGFSEAIKAAMEHSSRSTPELLELRGEVESEIRDLRELLRKPSKTSELCERIRELLRDAPDLDCLGQVQSLITPLCTNGLLSEKESHLLFKAAKRFHDRFQSLRNSSPKEARYRSGWDLDRKLRTNEPATVFIDGNNVLLQLKEVYSKSLDVGRIGPLARKTLAEHVAALAARSPKVRFHIVFDDDSQHVEHPAPNLTIELSGGVGRDRADNVIINHLAGLKRDVEGFVVTDDTSFKGASVHVGGVYVPSRLWHYLLCTHDVLPQYESLVTSDTSDASVTTNATAS
jgi:hypothetical protein